MNGSYNLSLVAVSVVVAVVASYTALDLGNRVSESVASPKKARSWLIGAGLMGTGIVSMHYTGMSAMQMVPSIRYDPGLFVASILIAIVASVAALGIALQLRRRISRFAIAARLGSSVIMGLAIFGTHYTGMAAARFMPGSICRAARSGGLRNDAQLVAAQSRLLSSARQAGMAEIAANVLHNVDNVLNSVNVSAEVIRAKLRDSKLDGLGQAVALMNERSTDLGRFFSNDAKGQRLPGYLAKLHETLQAEKRVAMDEIQVLTRSIAHIKEIVSTQQSYAGPAHLPEVLKIDESIDNALRISDAALTGKNISIVKDLATLPPVVLDKHLPARPGMDSGYIVARSRQRPWGEPRRAKRRPRARCGVYSRTAYASYGLNHE